MRTINTQIDWISHIFRRIRTSTKMTMATKPLQHFMAYFFNVVRPSKKCIHIECKCQFFFVVRIKLMFSVMIFDILIHLEWHTRVLLLCWIEIKQMRFQPQKFQASFLSNKKYYWMKYAIKSTVLFITLITTAYSTWSKWCCCFARRTP